MHVAATKLLPTGDRPPVNTEIVEVLQAAGLRRAWLVGGNDQACASLAATSRPVIAAVAQEMAHGEDLFERIQSLEWVLHAVHGSPVTVRFYFRDTDVPNTAIRLLDEPAVSGRGSMH